LQLSYIDKFLTDIQLEFRNRYKDVLQNRANALVYGYDFDDTFSKMLRFCEEESRREAQAGRYIYGSSFVS
jgi:signal recognition particle receptor subunit alpha